MTATAAKEISTIFDRAVRRAESPLRVWMYDPWCRTPWYTAALTRALSTAGHDVRLVCPSYSLEPHYFRDEGLILRPGLLDWTGRYSFVPTKLRQPGRLAEYLINTAQLSLAAALSPPQILHQQQCVLLEHGWRPELTFLRWCRERGVKVVHTVHNLLPHQEKPFHPSIYGELYELADALICHDEQAASALSRRFRVSRDRIHIAPHGPLFADVPSLSSARCRELLGLEPDRQIFLALGVLAHYKGLDLLLDAWADLVLSHQNTPKPLLVIAGNGPATEMRELQRRAASLGLGHDNLRLDLRYIRAAELPLYQNAADVLLYPYRDVTTSGALLTGLNYGKPIIASDLPAFREYLLPNTNALVVPPRNRGELAKALATMLQPASFGRLKAGSLNNRDLLVQWDEIGGRVADVYRAALA